MADRVDSGSIEHEGVVQEVSEGSVRINLPHVSHCAACHAKAGCSVSSSDSKIIEVQDDSGVYGPGEKVRVILDADMGPKALLFGYILPFFLVLSVLLLVWVQTNREGVSALAALGALLPYYTVLSFFRKKLQKTFSFRISRI